MPILFQSRPGAVVKLDDPAIQCSTSLYSMDPEISFDVQRSIVTRLTVNQQVNLQFLHTLGSLIYIYVFGDRMGQISLSGLSFNCGACNPFTDVLGMEKMMMWYNDNRASKRKKPVRVTIGRTVLEGFVTSSQADVIDPSLNLVQWTVQMASLPQDV